MGAASAADMPVKAPYVKAPVAMVYDWTGFYIGVNAGVGIGRDYTRMAIPAGPSWEASYLNPQGGLGGGQIGYNWQSPNTFLGAIVFGVEADIQGTGMRDNYSCLLGCLPGLNLNYNQRLDWFGTVRGRVGLATGPVLSYVTAGWAYGSVKTTVTETILGTTGDVHVRSELRRLGLGQRRRSLARRQLDRQDRISLPQSRRPAGQFRAQRFCPHHAHRHKRAYLPRRPQLSHRRQHRSLRAAAALELGRLLSRRQYRLRHRARQDRVHLRRSRRFDRAVQPEPRRHQRWRAGRLQLAGRELGVRSGG